LLSRFSCLQNLPFEKVKHVFGEPDAQPTPNGGIIILVTGQLVVRNPSEEADYLPWFDAGMAPPLTVGVMLGRRRAAPSPLLAGVPALPGPRGPVVRLQRRLQAGAWLSGRSTPANELAAMMGLCQD
jgi:hypothetical protein